MQPLGRFRPAKQRQVFSEKLLRGTDCLASMQRTHRCQNPRPHSGKRKGERSVTCKHSSPPVQLEELLVPSTSRVTEQYPHRFCSGEIIVVYSSSTSRTSICDQRKRRNFPARRTGSGCILRRRVSS